MAITGEMIGGDVTFAINGDVRMVAKVELVDDTLGRLTTRTIAVDDPAIVAQVTAFVEQMLPSLSTALGIPVSLPATEDE